jgi:hypothetical protein
MELVYNLSKNEIESRDPIRAVWLYTTTKWDMGTVQITDITNWMWLPTPGVKQTVGWKPISWFTSRMLQNYQPHRVARTVRNKTIKHARGRTATEVPQLYSHNCSSEHHKSKPQENRPALYSASKQHCEVYTFLPKQPNKILKNKRDNLLALSPKSF